MIDYKVAIIFIVGLILSILVFGNQKSGSSTVIIDAEVSDGRLIQIFINEENENPYSLNIIENKRVSYRFDKLPDNIKLLRIDPSDEAGSIAKIYGLEIFNKDRLIKKISPIQIKEDWNIINGNMLGDSSDIYKVQSNNHDPILYSYINIISNDSNYYGLKKYIKFDPLALFVILNILFILIAGNAYRNYKILIALPAAILTSYLTSVYIVNNYISNMDISKGVGYAAYNHLNKAAEYLAMYGGIILGTVSIIVIGLIFRHYEK